MPWVSQGAESNYKNPPGGGTDPPGSVELSTSGRDPAPTGKPDPVRVSDKAELADREALGRSRGGLSTKIHLAADARCRPVSRVLTAGQRHDSIAFETVMARLRIARSGRGRPRTRPDRVLADKAYSAKAIRVGLRTRGITATIPQPSDQVAHRVRRGRRGGRPPAFDAEAYKTRNVVERAINKLRVTRGVATRYDKREYVYLGTIDVASIRIWLRDPPRTQLRDTP